jgi:uroporphyrinogen decarboxylase
MADMTPRERYLATMRFQTPDRIPLQPGWGRKSTRERWLREGLPPDTTDILQYAYRRAGGRLPWPEGGPGFPVNERMIPIFEEKVVQELPDSRIVQDWKGNICEIGKEFGIEYLRDAIDFVTRRWIKCPVESRADWEDIKRRYDPQHPARLPNDAAALGAALKARRHPITLSFSGPFWQLREWLGFEQLCMLFLDDPAWVREMIAFWEDYLARFLKRILTVFVPDHVHINEDMAYKVHPMIGPEMARDFLLPTWKRWSGICRDAGVALFGIDSDGDISSLLPVFIDAGVDNVDPMEVAAGIDLPALRRLHGRRLAYKGGVDKRCMARGGQSIVDEIERLKPVMASGGYIPGCDHGVPSDVSWPDFVHYVGLLAQATGW